MSIKYGDTVKDVISTGNGRLDAVSNAIKDAVGEIYTLESYTEHAIEEKTSSAASSYVGIKSNGVSFWGAGIDSDIIVSSVKALISAVNIMLKKRQTEERK